ncbi:MAG: hypothetical protein E7353_10000 [Clostridiales bacterium]|nr:hypothetical protein [Clostridiales bacterium]
MHNFTIISKGEYNHKQTSDQLGIARYMIIRKKQRRYLLLDLENKNTDHLTAISIQGDQYDEEGNFLGVINVSVDGLDKPSGRFILKERIDLHKDCADVFVKIVNAEYGYYKYCLDENGNYSVLDVKPESTEIPFASVEKKVGKTGHVASKHKFKSPIFMSMMSVVVLLLIVCATIFQVQDFKKDKTSFFLNGVVYEYIDGNTSDGSPLCATGFSELNGGNVIIQSNVEGHPVTTVKAGAFMSNDKVKSVTVNGNVLIEENAFSDCDNLTSVTLNGVSVIGEGAFSNCYALSKVSINECDVIGKDAFNACTSLENVKISNKYQDRILEMGEHAFSNCKIIDSLTIDQFMNYGEQMDFLKGTAAVKTLSLKNYNYKDYEIDPSNVNKGILSIFGENAKARITNLFIQYSSAIPNDFMYNAESDLKTITFEGLDSTIIGDRAFNNCVKLQEFNAPVEFTKVGEYAFENTKITSFNAKRLFSIGDGAFKNCKKLEDFDLTENTALTALPFEAFKGTGSMDFYIPARIKTIADNVFDSSGVKSVVFDSRNTIEDLPNQFLIYCSKLETVVLPTNLKTIGESAFFGCRSLKEVTIPETVTTINSYAFMDNVSLTEFSIPDGVTYIGDGVLNGCTKIESLKTPYLGMSIGQGAHIGYLFGKDNYSLSSNLTKVKITKDTVVGNEAFCGCMYLTDVEISPYTETIGNRAFTYCYNLTSFEIPQSVNNIDFTAFDECYRLFEIQNNSSVSVVRGMGIATYALAVYSPNQPKIPSYEKDGYKLLKADGVWYLTGIPNEKVLTLPTASEVFDRYTIPDYFFILVSADSVSFGGEVKVIGKEAFANSRIKEVCATGYTDIILGEKAFANSTALKTVDLSATAISNIPDSTFANDRNLETLLLPSTVTTLGSESLYDCSKLKTLDLPAGLKMIGDRSFENCLSLKEINMENATELNSIGAYAFSNCSALKAIVLPQNVQYIHEGAFSNCVYAQEIRLPSSVIHIDNNVMNGCNNVKTLSVPFLGQQRGVGYKLNYLFDGYQVPYTLRNISVTNDTVVGSEAFGGIYWIETITLSDSIKTIEDGAFYGCSGLKKITLPASLRSIGDYAFNACSQLEQVETNSLLQTIGTEAFTSCTALENITLPQSLQSVGDNAFSECHSLQSISIPDSVTAIGYGVFRYCYALKSVSLGRGLTTIPEYAFSSSGVKEIKLSSTITTIERGAFSGCSALKALEFNSRIQNIGDHAFNGTAITTLNFPASIKKIGVYSFSENYYLETVIFSAGTSSSIRIDDTAFSGSNQIYQVYDLARLGIKRKSNTFGGVASNAVIVNTSSSDSLLEKATIQNVEYRYSPDVCAIVKIGSVESLELGAVTLGNVTYESIIVASYATSSYINKLTITNAIIEIYPYAFNTYIKQVVFNNSTLYVKAYSFTGSVDNIVYDSKLGGIERNSFSGSCKAYFYGTSAQWSANANASNFYSVYRPSYYYSECFHSYNSHKWNYTSSGYVNTDYTDYNYRILKNNSCTEDGEEEYYCDICKYSEKYVIEAHGHYYRNYVCQHCDKIERTEVTNSNVEKVMRYLFTFKNDELYAYDAFSNTSKNSVTSTNVEANSVSEFSIKATRKITVSFKYSFSSDDIGKLLITTPTTQLEYDHGSDTLSMTLEKGQEMVFRFERSDVIYDNCYVRIGQIVIS